MLWEKFKKIAAKEKPGWWNLPAGRQVGRHARYYVYALTSEVRTYIYVGLTDNITRRLAEHNKGKNKTTRPYRPFRLIHTESFKTRIEARVREKELKSGYGKEFLKKIAAKEMPGWWNLPAGRQVGRHARD